MKLLNLAVLLFCIMPVMLWPQDADIWNALSVRNGFSILAQGIWDDPGADATARLGWKPEIGLDIQPLSGLYVNADLVMDNAVRASFGGDNANQDIEIGIYRAWLSLGTESSILRGGLQHIQFGPARIIRPLQWFDSLAPSDLFAASRGITGILLSHYFPDPNLRLWVIAPDNDLPRNLLMPSGSGQPELGGRFELRTPAGDSGFSFHHRVLDDNALAEKELRFGFDHRMDGVMGLWMEASASLYEHPAALVPKASISATVGYDYTIAVANGIGILMEHNLLASTPSSVQDLHSEGVTSALLATYPGGLLDSFNLLGIWNWTESGGYVSVAWRRVYDYLSFELGVSTALGGKNYQGVSSGAYLKVALDM